MFVVGLLQSGLMKNCHPGVRWASKTVQWVCLSTFRWEERNITRRRPICSQRPLPSKVLGVLGKHDLHGVLIVLLGAFGACWSWYFIYWLWLRKLCLLAESFTQISSVYLNFQTLHCVQSAAGWTFTKLSLPWQVLNDHLPTAGPDPDIPDWLVITPHQPVFPGPP